VIEPTSYYMPSVEWETPKGTRQSDLYSRLLREHIIFLGTPIDDTVANLVCAQLLFLESENPDREIATLCFGQAASAAAVLLAAGSPGKRLALPNARVLIHQPYAQSGYAQVSDLEIAANEILRLKATLEHVLAHHTGQDVERISRDTDRDYVMTAAEAKEYGIIDEVIDTRNPADNSGPITAIR
jgi:ATP-dependent Clp protease protease subunit